MPVTRTSSIFNWFVQRTKRSPSIAFEWKNAVVTQFAIIEACANPICPMSMNSKVLLAVACTRRDSCYRALLLILFTVFNYIVLEDVEAIIAKLSTLYTRHRIKYATNYFVCLGARRQFIHKRGRGYLAFYVYSYHKVVDDM